MKQLVISREMSLYLLTSQMAFSALRQSRTYQRMVPPTGSPSHVNHPFTRQSPTEINVDQRDPDSPLLKLSSQVISDGVKVTIKTVPGSLSSQEAQLPHSPGDPQEAGPDLSRRPLAMAEDDVAHQTASDFLSELLLQTRWRPPTPPHRSPQRSFCCIGPRDTSVSSAPQIRNGAPSS